MMQEIAKMDVDDIMAKQVEQLEKEKKELQEKLKGQEKKVLTTNILGYQIQKGFIFSVPRHNYPPADYIVQC